jgi:hypothetical protein
MSFWHIACMKDNGAEVLGRIDQTDPEMAKAAALTGCRRVTPAAAARGTLCADRQSPCPLCQ